MSRSLKLLPFHSLAPSCDYSHIIVDISYCKDWDHFIKFCNENGYPVEDFYPQGVSSYVATVNNGEDDEHTGYGKLSFVDPYGDELKFVFACDLANYFKENEENFTLNLNWGDRATIQYINALPDQLKIILWWE